MGLSRSAVFVIPAAAAWLLWPALWNGYPIVFADTGTYLSQAIHHYAGWDRPVFYSVFMLPLHAMLTLWPVVVAQALLAAWVLWLVCRVLVPGLSVSSLGIGVAVLSVCTWLPWIVCELMPDLFTPLLVLVLCLLAWTPGRMSGMERAVLVALASFMIASQQSSLPLACALLVILAAMKPLFRDPYAAATAFASVSRASSAAARVARTWSEAARSLPMVPSTATAVDGFAPAVPRGGSPLGVAPSSAPEGMLRWPMLILPPALAVLALCSVNLAAHGRLAVSPFGNVFLLARVIYDGPGMAVLRRDCPTENWRLCPFLGGFPPNSDDFLWSSDSPLYRAGGPKAVSRDAGAIIQAALLADPAGEARSALANTLEQLARFDSGDGLNPWPAQVSRWIERDFPAREAAAYAGARQQAGTLSVPPLLVRIHSIAALGGVVGCAILLPIAFRRRSCCTGFLLAVLLALPISAAITGGLSAPHDRYQARIMWLPPFIAMVSVASLRRRAS